MEQEMHGQIGSSDNGARISFLKLTEFMRFPLAVFVVAIHWRCVECCRIILEFDQNKFEYASTAFNYLFNMIICSAVPLFFLISGYLYFININGKKFTLDNYLQKCSRRAKTLFIPYICWCLLAFFLTPLYSIFNDGYGLETYWSDLCGNTSDCLLHVFWDIVEEPTNVNVRYPMLVPLWYIRDLMVVSLFAPLFLFVIYPMKYKGISFIRNVLLLGVMIWLRWQKYWPFDRGLSWIAVFWFGVGGTIAMQKCEASLYKLSMGAPYLLVILLVSGCFLGAKGGSELIIVRLTHSILLYLALLLCGWLISRKMRISFPPIYIAATMFIYCWHCLPVLGSQRLLYSVIKRTPIAEIDYQSPAFILLLIIPPLVEAVVGVYVYKLWHRISPTSSQFMLGGR